MTSEGPAALAVGLLSDVIDRLLSPDRSKLSRDELLDLTRAFEGQARRLPTIEHHLVAEIDSRKLAAELRYRDTAALLSQLLMLTRRQAGDRVADASELGPRKALSGEVLPPQFPAAAAALAEGSITAAHAAVIRKTVHELPHPTRAEHAQSIDRTLTEHAVAMDTRTLAIVAQRVVATLHPDGDEVTDRIHR